MELLTTLLPHQQAAVDKLIGIRVGALYMEMGTGKTRTTLEMIKRRLDAGKIDRVLWFCPCSVRTKLREDIAKHANGALAKIAIVGTESLSGSKRLMGTLTNYVMRGKTMLVVDESNLIKNHMAIRTQRIEQLANLCPYRIILNGTPVSKNEADLYAQWKILDWRILGYQSFWSFSANHLEYDERYRRKVRRVLNVDYLTDKIAPYCYMAKKDDVFKGEHKLPPKRTRRQGFSLTSGQMDHYYTQMDAFLATLVDDDDEAAIYRTFTALQEISSGRWITSDASKPIKHEPFFENPEDNPRIQALLSEISAAPEEKTIIWCKFQHEIDDIERVLTSHYGEGSARTFCGELSQKKRQKSLRDFRAGTKFLIANKTCAGYGLNLQFAHRAIYYNNDWDWATRAQSEDRIHRIGQTSDVDLIDLYAIDTIDRRILDCLSKKDDLVSNFKAAITGKNARKWLTGKDVEGTNDTDRNKKQ